MSRELILYFIGNVQKKKGPYKRIRIKKELHDITENLRLSLYIKKLEKCKLVSPIFGLCRNIIWLKKKIDLKDSKI